MLKHYITLLIITVLMIGALIFAYQNGGNPEFIKDQKIDQATTREIQSQKYSIEDYAYTNKQLPDSLNDLAKSTTIPIPNNSGVTNEEITYKVTSASSYALCSTFKTDNQITSSVGDYTGLKHPEGAFCFDFDVPSLKQPETNPARQSGVYQVTPQATTAATMP